MAELVNSLVNIIGAVFTIVAFLAIVALLLGSSALFIIIAAGFGKRFFVEHEENHKTE